MGDVDVNLPDEDTGQAGQLGHSTFKVPTQNPRNSVN